MHSAIIEKIKSADNLPSLPTVAVQVLRMTQAEDVTIADIARVIQQDPAMTVKILKIVNSSLFGLSRKISSVQQAMVVLGLRSVKVMVLSFSLVDTMRNRHAADFDHEGYWRRSLTTAVAAKLLCEKLQRSCSEEAFVSGLLCDIGMLAAYHCAADLYTPVLRAHEARGGPIQLVEQEMLGVTHQAMTSVLLDHWHLPGSLCQAVSSHHAPLWEPGPGGSENLLLVRAVRAAAMLADLFCSHTDAGSLNSCRRQLSEELPIYEPALHRILEALDSQVKETASLFSLKIGPTKSYQDIQGEAVAQLARLSMAAELERAQMIQSERAARQEVEQLNTLNRQLAQQASTDGLTGIANRQAFEEHLAKLCATAAEQRKGVGLLMLDLDRFKKLNDTFGHPIGDEALRMVGQVLRKRTSESVLPARYGGEEFAVILAGPSESELRLLAEELRAAIHELSIPFGQKRISITVSVGAAFAEPGDAGLTPRSITKRADECLYEAKYRGRNRVVFATLKPDCQGHPVMI